MLIAASIPFLNEMVALFVVSVLIAYACYRLKLVPIAGFLIAGVIIGPNALGLVQNQELVDALAEIAVVLLLFTQKKLMSWSKEKSIIKVSDLLRRVYLGISKNQNDPRATRRSFSAQKARQWRFAFSAAPSQSTDEEEIETACPLLFGSTQLI